MRLFATVCAVAALALSGPAFAQQTNGPVTGDQAAANSQSGATAANNNANTSTVGPVTVGPIDASSGPVTSTSQSGANAQLQNTSTVGPIDSSVRVGPSTSNSQSQSGALSGSVSTSQGGEGGASDAHSTATGGISTSNATGGTSNAVTGPSTSSSVANPNANNQGNAQNITFNNVTPNKQKIESVPQVYAPALTTTLTETCMGSTSGGISVLGFGGTLGTTWNDTQCVRRLNARELAQTLGDRAAARALMCQDKNVAEAYAAVGQDCRQKYEVAVMVPPPAPVSPVVINMPPTPAPVQMMAPVPNPPEPRIIYRDRPVVHHKAAPKPGSCPTAKVCPSHD